MKVVTTLIVRTGPSAASESTPANASAAQQSTRASKALAAGRDGNHTRVSTSTLPAVIRTISATTAALSDSSNCAREAGLGLGWLNVRLASASVVSVGVSGDRNNGDA